MGQVLNHIYRAVITAQRCIVNTPLRVTKHGHASHKRFLAFVQEIILYSIENIDHLCKH